MKNLNLLAIKIIKNNMTKIIQEKNRFLANFAKKNSAGYKLLNVMKEFILEKNHFLANFVKKNLATYKLLNIMKEFIQEKNHFLANFVKKNSTSDKLMKCMKEFILEYSERISHIKILATKKFHRFIKITFYQCLPYTCMTSKYK